MQPPIVTEEPSGMSERATASASSLDAAQWPVMLRDASPWIVFCARSALRLAMFSFMASGFR